MDRDDILKRMEELRKLSNKCLDDLTNALSLDGGEKKSRSSSQESVDSLKKKWSDAVHEWQVLADKFNNSL